MQHATLQHLQTFLTATHPGAVLIPTKSGGKLPMFAHKKKDGHPQYDAAKFLATGSSQCQHGCGIILPQSIIVVDVDDHELAAKMVANFPEFAETVTCATAKGFHFYFSRTPRCKLTDGARRAGTDLPIDIKTQTRTGTDGIISIPPIPSKRWVREPGGEHCILPIPDEFVAYFTDAIKTLKQPSPPTDHLTTHDLVAAHPAATSATLGAEAPTLEPVDRMSRLLPLLSKNSWDDRTMWRDIATALKNDFGDAMKPEWLRLSRISPKFDEAECETLWSSVALPDFEVRRLTCATIERWARRWTSTATCWACATAWSTCAPAPCPTARRTTSCTRWWTSTTTSTPTPS